MNILLLSGGSGKRLWPLSNNVRSKQFIKVLRAPTGCLESMVQRVYRQIKTVIKDTSVTIATSKNQISEIVNQLGDDVDICVEPCRRDTFPAIVLSCLYLKYVRHISSDDVVVVSPVDPYVDDSYFVSLKRLSELTEKTDSNICLLGIEPTYPSEKYGYIIPDSADIVSHVKMFKEKPTESVAKDYISCGALWNAGVFAFKLGYLIEKAHEVFDFADYADFLSKYSNVTEISFDYAVVEKESSISVMKYRGEWKDLGTWNTLTDVITDKTTGKAIVAEDCIDVHVLNELPMPILCMGLSNAVIASSPEGILVASKEKSPNIKKYVEKLEQGVMFAEKSWGLFKIVAASHNCLVIQLTIEQGKRMSYHSHNNRDEVWIVTEGYGMTIIDGMQRTVRKGDVITICEGSRHSIVAESRIELIEIQLGDDIFVGDKVKYSL